MQTIEVIPTKQAQTFAAPEFKPDASANVMIVSFYGQNNAGQVATLSVYLANGLDQPGPDNLVWETQLADGERFSALRGAILGPQSTLYVMASVSGVVIRAGGLEMPLD